MARWASGSSRWVSQPCWLTSTWGWNARTSGGATESMARSHAASPVPGGSATLTALPRASGPPMSAGQPVPGKRCWPFSWTEMVSTRGSFQNIRSTPSPWCTSMST